MMAYNLIINNTLVKFQLWRERSIMLNLKKILWADDGSKASENALKVTEYLAKTYDSEIIGVYVNDIYYPITPDYFYFDKYFEEISRKNKNIFTKKFKKIGTSLSKKKVNFASKIISGTVAETIIKTANKSKAGLITIGNTGHGYVTNLLLGSNALKIIKSSKVPVLSVPETFKPKKYVINKILVPIDLAEKNLNSLNFAIEIAQSTNSSVTILYVLPIATSFMQFPPSIKEKLIKGIEDELNKLINEAKEIAERHNIGMKHRVKKATLPDITIRKKHLAGMKPSKNITDFASRNNYDLIVMNSHNKGMIEDLILGSVTEEVIRSSKCPVISIKL